MTKNKGVLITLGVLFTLLLAGEFPVLTRSGFVRRH